MRRGEGRGTDDDEPRLVGDIAQPAVGDDHLVRQAGAAASAIGRSVRSIMVPGIAGVRRRPASAAYFFARRGFAANVEASAAGAAVSADVTGMLASDLRLSSAISADCGTVGFDATFAA